MRPFRLTLGAALALPWLLSASPAWLENQFEIPFGFHLYKAAGPDLSGGSYAITLDGEGRLLVGDGQAVRRLTDADQDGVFDAMETIATGLGPRGPQGLLVYGDKLFAIGQDGLQLYTGYQGGGTLRHAGRIGAPFHTGGDHTAHTLLRGHDGYVYLVTGDGGGTEDRLHITEDTSPALHERAASVFRISPDGQHWECLARGGRNPPNLGLHYLGDMFSWDSDMEWHVDVPWYRPVRLNHWVWGSDQGWQSVGAYPPYFIDTLPGVLETGRGSPDWGVFYEHGQWPERFLHAYLVCDYPWKSAASGRYNTAGRLVAFHLQRQGAGWTASMEVVARPKPGARDDQGQPIQFALVDASVAPDGSLFLSDHNQGIWRVIYDAQAQVDSGAAPRWDVPAPSSPAKDDASSPLEELLHLPQPGAEWSRVRSEALSRQLGDGHLERLEGVALDANRPLSERLSAVRYLSASFATASEELLQGLAASPHAELRAQAAWMMAWRMGDQSDPRLLRMLDDQDPFVRRRAAEALNRSRDTGPIPDLLARLKDPDRLVRYAAMTALERRPSEVWLPAAWEADAPQVRLRALAAYASSRSGDALRNPSIQRAWQGLRAACERSEDDELDLLRVISLYREALLQDPLTRDETSQWLASRFPSPHRDVRWEQARVLGAFQVESAFPKLLAALESESDPHAQFHLAAALAHFESGWTREEARRLSGWFKQTQTGWFASPLGKGRQFPDFWRTVVDEFSRHHRETLLADTDGVDYLSPLGEGILDRWSESKEGRDRLRALLDQTAYGSVQHRILRLLGEEPDAATGKWLAARASQETKPDLRNALLSCLARMPFEASYENLLREGVAGDSLDTAVACARSLARAGVSLDQPSAERLLQRAIAQPQSLRWIGSALAAFAPNEHPAWARPPEEDRREWNRDRAMTYWRQWYERVYHRPLPSPAEAEALSAAETSHTAEDLVAFLCGEDVKGGQAVRGLDVFLELQCASCHGGDEIGTAGKLFGPDLAGVTRRLNRRELAEALAWPSKTVAERFKATEIELKNGLTFTGFITAESPEFVTLSIQDGLRRIARGEVASISSQDQSLMPEDLLARASWDQIRDLYAYLEQLGTSTTAPSDP